MNKKTKMNSLCLSEKKLRRTVAALLCCVPLAAFALDTGKIAPQEIAVYVQDMQTGQVLEAHRADVSMQPASVMKLVTTFAALRALGPDFSWQTEFKSNAPVRNGVLEGDVYWVGSGNPVFDQKDVLQMQQQMRAQGIQHIRGQLVFDDSVLSSNGSADDFESDAGETFATPPSPHMLAYKVVWAKAVRNPLGDIAFETNPPLPAIPHQIDVQSGGLGNCTSLKNYVSAAYRSGVLHFNGKLPESCIGSEMFINMLDMDEFASQSFINQWRSIGGEIADGHRADKAPARAETLAGHRSQPLSQVLRDMNKNSNNVIARSLFLTLGAQRAGQQTVQNARAEVRRELVAAGLDDEALNLENGSGLSRRERATARMLGEMLAVAWKSPFRQAFVDSLPIGGVDGTLKSRFAAPNQNGRFYLKTGTLDNVRALAGYWLPANNSEGNPLAVVVMVNSKQAKQYLGEMDKVVGRVVTNKLPAVIDTGISDF